DGSTKGLWGIGFGNGEGGAGLQTLFFATGPNDESDGVFGMVQAAPADPHDKPPAEQLINFEHELRQDMTDGKLSKAERPALNKLFADLNAAMSDGKNMRADLAAIESEVDRLEKQFAQNSTVGPDLAALDVFFDRLNL